MQSVNEYISNLDELNVLILLEQCFDSKEWKTGILYYLLKFGNKKMDDNKLTALNIFARYFEELMNTDIDILSDLATVYTTEPAFENEYRQVCNQIDKIIGRK